MQNQTAETTRPTSTPPSGPRPIPSLGLRASLARSVEFHRDQLGFVERAVHNYGDIFRMRLLGLPLVMVNHPAYVQRVLVDNHENYDKDNLLYRLTRPVFRGGIVTSVGGEPWRRQRRLMQPCFHRPNIAAFATNMSDETGRMLDRWAARADRPIEICGDLGHLALRIVTRTLFGADVGASTDDRERKFTRDQPDLRRLLPVPHPANVRADACAPQAAPPG